METLTKFKSKTGSAIMTVMGMILVLSIVAGGFYSFSAGAIFQTRRLADSIRAKSIAEAGANEAVGFLMQPGYFSYRNDASSFPETTFGGGSYAVTVEDVSGTNNSRSRIISVGTYNEVSSAVVVDIRDAYLEQVEGGDEASWRDFALFANGDLTFNGSPTIVGDVHTNNEWDNNGNYSGVSGQISAINSNEVPEAYRADWKLIPFPSLSDPAFQVMVSEARAKGQLTEYFGNQSFRSNMTFNASASGITIVYGNITFLGSGNQTVRGLLYITGDLTANGSGTMTLNGALLSGGFIRFNGKAGVYSYSAIGSGGSGSGYGPGSTNYIADVKVYATWQSAP